MLKHPKTFKGLFEERGERKVFSKENTNNKLYNLSP